VGSVAPDGRSAPKAALDERKGPDMVRDKVDSPHAPAAIGPYSQGVWARDLLYLSGQTPIDPATGNFVSENVAEQTEQVLKNLDAVLQAAGSSLEGVVKTTVFLADMNDFAEMNEVYGRFFRSVTTVTKGTSRPA
jgi:2-iminobutanoate/2-iminopropanoate deaminase